jgi:sugar lactone lactonase YvrE
MRVAIPISLFVASVAMCGNAYGGGSLYWVQDGAPEVHRMGLNGMPAASIILPSRAVTAFTIDPRFGVLYWAGIDPAERFVMGSADPHGSSRTWLAGNEPPDVAVDSLRQQLYWGNDAFLGLQRSGVDGTNVETFLPETLTGGYVASVDVDPQGGRIYWIATNPTSSGELGDLDGEIWRSNLDGSGRELLIDQANNGPISLVLDPATSTMFWTDIPNGSLTGRIWRANLDGTNSEVWLDNLPRPLTMAIDSPGEMLYWFDGSSSTIFRASIVTGEVSTFISLEPLFGHSGTAVVLAIDTAIIPEPSTVRLVVAAIAAMWLVTGRYGRATLQVR